MTDKCKICGSNILIFIWSTSRAIDKEKLGQIEQFKDVVNLERLAFPICKACVKEHELLEEKYVAKKV